MSGSSRFLQFLKKKNVEISAKRYGIDALGAMAQGLFASLLIGTIFKTLGSQLGIQMFTDIGTFASAVAGTAVSTLAGASSPQPASITAHKSAAPIFDLIFIIFPSVLH